MVERLCDDAAAVTHAISQLGHIREVDVEEFIDCKLEEEKKAWALIDAGYDGNFNGGAAYASVFFQNSNNSVRVTEEFMDRADRGEEWELTARVDGSVVEQICTMPNYARRIR